MEHISYRPGRALSQSEGFSIIEAYFKSGMSSSAFYKQLGMSEKTFYKWRKYYMQGHSMDRQEPAAMVCGGRLLPIQVVSAGIPDDADIACQASTGYIYEVELANGVCVRMQDASHAERLLCICNGLK